MTEPDDPPSAGMPPYWIVNARTPKCLLGSVPSGATIDAEDLVLVDLRIEAGRIAAIEPSGPPRSGTLRDQDGGQVWPGPVDLHTHLDKGHIWPRAQNPDGTFEGALAAVGSDREAHWTAEDVAARFDFGLRCAYAHGTVAIRTHLDSIGKQTAISWPVFAALRDAWAGRIALQAVSLIGIGELEARSAAALADTVADFGGVFGAVTYMVPDLEERLDLVFRIATARRLDLDFHVDETADPTAASLRLIAEAASRHKFAGRIVAGHCCSLAMQPPAVALATLDRVAEAGISVVTLPMCNLYLQDRMTGRTPRWRGITLVREMAERGIPVAAASDNCRDPFYGYGDHDLMEVFRETVRIGHLDRPVANWPALITTVPADVMGLQRTGRLAVGLPADLILLRERGYSEVLSRIQADRMVLRAGLAIDGRLPDYRELDPLFAEWR